MADLCLEALWKHHSFPKFNFISFLDSKTVFWLWTAGCVQTTVAVLRPILVFQTHCLDNLKAAKSSLQKVAHGGSVLPTFCHSVSHAHFLQRFLLLLPILFMFTPKVDHPPLSWQWWRQRVLWEKRQEECGRALDGVLIDLDWQLWASSRILLSPLHHNFKLNSHQAALKDQVFESVLKQWPHAHVDFVLHLLNWSHSKKGCLHNQ